MKSIKLTQSLVNKVITEARATLKEEDWDWLTLNFATIVPYVTKADDGSVVFEVPAVHDGVMVKVEWVHESKCWSVEVLALDLLDKFQPSWVPVIKNLRIAPDVSGVIRSTVVSALGLFQERLTRLAKAAALHMVSVIEEKKKDGH